MEHVSYTPSGVCARQIDFDLEDGKLHNVKFTGGCDGNTKAIAKLLEGADAANTVSIPPPPPRGVKGTSCADQLARGIESALK